MAEKPTEGAGPEARSRAFARAGTAGPLRGFPVFFFFLLALASVSFAAPPVIVHVCEPVSFQQSFTYMGFGMAAILALIAIAFMLGTALSNPHLLDWAKTEAAQVLLSVLFFAVILWLVSLECSIRIDEFTQWSGLGLGIPVAGGDYNMFSTAQAYLDWGVGQTHLTITMIRYEMGLLNIRATFNNFLPQMAGLGGNGYSNSPHSGDWTTIGTMNMLLNLNSTFLLSILLQYFALVFFSASNGFFIFLVPVGFLFRSIPFGRPIGSTLVAIGVGLYIFYPIVFAMMGLIVPNLYVGGGGDVSGVLSAQADSSIRSDPSIQSSDPVRQMSAIYARESALASNPYDAYTGGEDSLPNALLHPANSGKLVDLPQYFRLTALNFLRAVLFPSVGLLLAVMFIRDLAALLGEEVDASKLIQMV